MEQLQSGRYPLRPALLYVLYLCIVPCGEHIPDALRSIPPLKLGVIQYTTSTLTRIAKKWPL